jgi:hypothetical protein
MDRCRNNGESSKTERVVGDDSLERRELLNRCIAFAGALTMGVGPQAIGAARVTQPRSKSEPGWVPKPEAAPLDAAAEAKKIAFDRKGSGEKVLLISGFPQTRLSRKRFPKIRIHSCRSAELRRLMNTVSPPQQPRTSAGPFMSSYRLWVPRCTSWLMISAHGVRTAGLFSSR